MAITSVCTVLSNLETNDMIGFSRDSLILHCNGSSLAPTLAVAPGGTSGNAVRVCGHFEGSCVPLKHVEGGCFSGLSKRHNSLKTDLNAFVLKNTWYVQTIFEVKSLF